jgi:hypothetical protein
VGYYYIGRDISWEDFKKDIQKFNEIFLRWNNEFIPEVVKRAYDERTKLFFKHHFRDFLIGIECERISINPTSNNNKNHFTWLKDFKCYTPEEFLMKNSLKKYLKIKLKIYIFSFFKIGFLKYKLNVFF